MPSLVTELSIHVHVCNAIKHRCHALCSMMLDYTLTVNVLNYHLTLFSAVFHSRPWDCQAATLELNPLRMP
jgi:hypothetical protein